MDNVDEINILQNLQPTKTQLWRNEKLSRSVTSKDIQPTNEKPPNKEKPRTR